jgi:hypothetical protein
MCWVTLILIPLSLIVLDNKTEAAPADAKKEDPPKSPSILAKLLAPFKNVKAPKSPKKEKKEEIKVGDI